MIELIPAIDLRQGRVVRLERGDDARRRDYDRDPLEVLAELAMAGVRRVHLVDLDAAFGEPPQRHLVKRLARAAAAAGADGPAIELGGGIRDRSAIEWALQAGCDRVVLGSLVARDPEGFAALATDFPGRLVPAVEVSGDTVRVAGWREDAPLGVDDLSRRLRHLPCPAILVTDVERDGTLAGPNLELARRVGATSGLGVLVSGGVRSTQDLALAAAVPEVVGVIVGKAFYDGLLDVGEALTMLGGGR